MKISKLLLWSIFLTFIFYFMSRMIGGIDLSDYVAYQANIFAILGNGGKLLIAPEYMNWNADTTLLATPFAYPNEFHSSLLYGLRLIGAFFFNCEWLAGGYLLSFISFFVSILSMLIIFKNRLKKDSYAILGVVFLLLFSPIITNSLSRSYTDPLLFASFVAMIAYLTVNKAHPQKVLWIAGCIMAIGVMARLQGLVFLPFIPFLFLKTIDIKKYFSFLYPIVIPSITGLSIIAITISLLNAPIIQSPIEEQSLRSSFFYLTSICDLLSSVSYNYFFYFSKNLLSLGSPYVAFFLSIIFLFTIFYKSVRRELLLSRDFISYIVIGLVLILFPIVLYSTDAWSTADRRYYIYGLFLISVVTIEMFFSILSKLKTLFFVLITFIVISLALMHYILTFSSFPSFSVGSFYDFNNLASFLYSVDANKFLTQTVYAYRPMEEAGALIKNNFTANSLVLTNTKAYSIFVYSPNIVCPLYFDHRIEKDLISGVSKDSAFYLGENNHLFEGILLEKEFRDFPNGLPEIIVDKKGVAFDCIYNSNHLTMYPYVMGVYKRRNTESVKKETL